MEQLLDYLKHQPKEILQWIILELMRSEKLSFTDIATAHVKYIEALKRGEVEELMNLRSKVIDLWVSTKKALPSKLVSLMQEAKDKGWANITQEQIEKSKWKK